MALALLAVLGLAGLPLPLGSMVLMVLRWLPLSLVRPPPLVANRNGTIKTGPQALELQRWGPRSVPVCSLAVWRCSGPASLATAVPGIEAPF